MKIYTCTILHIWDTTMKPLTASFSTRKNAELFARQVREISEDYITVIDSGNLNSGAYIKLLSGRDDDE